MKEKRPLTVKEMTLVAIFAAFTAGGAFVKIPFEAVPITLQTLFVLLSGIILGPRLAAWSQTIYVAIGLIGLPIFTGGGGPGYVYNPTFGYLLGFIAASYVVGYLVERFARGAGDDKAAEVGRGKMWAASNGKMPAADDRIQIKGLSRMYIGIFGASLIGSMIIYAIGLPYMYLILKHVTGMDITFAAALGIGMLRFLPGDIIKCAVAAAAAPKLISTLRRSGLGR